MKSIGILVVAASLATLAACGSNEANNTADANALVENADVNADVNAVDLNVPADNNATGANAANAADANAATAADANAASNNTQ